MSDDEFRKLYCWLIERVKPPSEVVDRILKNILAALNDKSHQRDSR